MKFANCMLSLALSAVAVGGCAAPHPARSPVDYLASSRKSRLNQVEWNVAHSFKFDDGFRIDSEHVLEGEWRVKGGRLVAVGGEQNRTILLARSGMDPVRIEFDARLHENAKGRIGDITVLLNTLSAPTYWNDGYSLTTSSFYNNCTTFYRLGEKLARTEWSPPEPGQWHRVAVEFDAGHIRYWLDERIVLEAWDPSPPTLSPHRWIGLRTWNTVLEVDNLAVSRGTLASSRRQGPLAQPFGSTRPEQGRDRRETWLTKTDRMRGRLRTSGFSTPSSWRERRSSRL